MIHDLLLSFLKPGASPKINDERLLHASEQTILGDIIQILDQHKQIQQFIIQYSTYGRNQPVTKLSETFDRSPQSVTEEPLQKGAYLHALADGIDQSLIIYRCAIVDLEQRYLKSPDHSLIFIFEGISRFEPMLTLLLRMITRIKSERLHGCSLLQYINQLSIELPQLEAIQIIQRSVHFVFLNQLSKFLIYAQNIDNNNEFFVQHSTDGGAPPGGGGSSAASDSGRNWWNTTATGPATTISDGISVRGGIGGGANWPYEIVYNMKPTYLSDQWAAKVMFIAETVFIFNENRKASSIGSDRPQRRNCTTNTAHINLNAFDVTTDTSSAAVTSLWANMENVYAQKLIHICPATGPISISMYEEVVDEIKNFISQRLSEIAINQSDLIKQLQLIKDFYLLGRGEFYLEFIRQLTPNVLGTANHSGAVFVNETVAGDICRTFEAAGHGVGEPANNMDQISLHVALDTTDSLANSFVDRLSLRYKDSWPLNLLFSKKIIEQYNGMFRFLLQIKVVQYRLHEVWSLLRMRHIERTSPVLQLRNKLMFFVDNLQYYLQVDVLDAQFSQLLTIVQTSRDFEHIKRAHTIFQANVLSLCFLLSKDKQPLTEMAMSVSLVAADLAAENSVLTGLRKILDITIQFCCFTERILLTDNDDANRVSMANRQQIQMMDKAFMAEVDELMKLLSGLKAGPSSAPLAQLLLRLDYNYWFSAQQQQNNSTK